MKAWNSLVQTTSVFPIIVTDQSIPRHAWTELRCGGNIDRLGTVCSLGSVVCVAHEHRAEDSIRQSLDQSPTARST